MPFRLFSKQEERAIMPIGPEKEVAEAFDRYLSTVRKPAERLRIREMTLRALDSKPDSVPSHAILGYLDMENEDLDGMMEHFLVALRFSDDPFNEYTWDLVTVSLHDNLEDAGRLAKYLTEFYERKPAGFVVKYLARACLGMGEPEKALPLVDKHLAGFPSDKDVMKLRRRIIAWT